MDTVIAVEDVHFTYPPPAPSVEGPSVLNGLSLTLNRGECLSLLGRTGAGKSTLCLTLNGIIPHLVSGTFRGDVRVLQQSTRESTVGELSQKVALVFQDPDSQLFNPTVMDEVAFGLESLALPPDVIETRVAEALEASGITSLRCRPALDLSGGEKQRVALAAALAMRPDVLVLDEPTASLDPAGKRSVLQAVDRLRSESGMTILWVTQDVDRVPVLADRVAVLHQGRIALEGRPRQIFARVEELRAAGLAVPQLSQLASRFNRERHTDYTWLTVGEACRDLKRELDA
ncbi:MAG: ATP-binding cassette domain-containing protein [Anaerolineae bacterium]